MIQNLWDIEKTVLRGKAIVIRFKFRRKRNSQINNLRLHLKQLEKEEQTNPKVMEGKKRQRSEQKQMKQT